MEQSYWLKALDINEVFAFLRDDAGKAAAEVLSADGVSAAFLSDEAVRDIEEDYIRKLGFPFTQILIAAVRERVKELDIEEYLVMKGTNTGAIDKACREVREELLKDRGMALREKYFLIKEFEEAIRSSFIDSKKEFLLRLAADKDEISEVLLGGQPVTKVLRLSSRGADTHRHGRTVIGVTTDAGVIYYKPHNCSLDAFYREFTQRWFSDCTIAPAVIDRGDYAFVQELKHAEVGELDGIRRFYRNFGCLIAGFHAIGSTDMHGENIISCGEYPCALDLETVFSYKARPQRSVSDADGTPPDGMAMDKPPWSDYAYSALKCGAFPFRIHKAGTISPLYNELESNKCLPRFEGKAHTIEGCEEDFMEGFREGYFRMLEARDEILPMLERYGKATLRILIFNTQYYALMLSRLYRPDALSDRGQQAKFLYGLRIPFDMNGLNANEAIVRYEADSIMNGDIPYFCSGIDSHDLCGEDNSRIVQEDYLLRSGVDTLKRRLSRLSEKEEKYEEALIRNKLVHAPLDVEERIEPYELSGSAPSGEDMRSEIRSILASLDEEKILHSDGETVDWISESAGMENLMMGGAFTSWSDTGILCAMVLADPELADVHGPASSLAEYCLKGTEKYLSDKRACGRTTEGMTAGLGVGIGGLMLSLEQLRKAGFEKAGELQKTLIDEIPLRAAREHAYSEGERGTCHPWNVQCGTAGLLIACSLIGADIPAETTVHLADEILDGLPAARIDGLYGSAGMGAALAYAYGITGEERFAKGAEDVFEDLHSKYNNYNKGWALPSKGMAWAASRAPYSAGIGLAADFCLRWHDCEPARKVLEQAVESLNDQKELLSNDTLNNGNALMALCFMRLSERQPELMDKAGQVLGSMMRRKESHGSFKVTPEGVRDFFDPSCVFGTTGIGCIISAYTSS